jgi:glutamate-ammonia-ligase adenylyltransferase
MKLAGETEDEARRTIHRAARGSAASDPGYQNLKAETRRVRLQLEKKGGPINGREIDIKFGEGGMLDIYFLMRFLQLRDDVPDDPEHRSSDFMLNKLRENGSIGGEDYSRLMDAYEFLSDLDHNLRLTVGRSTRVPLANRSALKIISRRMKLASMSELFEKLTFHRINVRSAFDAVVGT